MTSDISKELVILPSTMAPHRALGTCHTRSVLFELDEAQVPLSASNGFSCDGIAIVDKEVMAAKGKENVATVAGYIATIYPERARHFLPFRLGCGLDYSPQSFRVFSRGLYNLSHFL